MSDTNKEQEEKPVVESKPVPTEKKKSKKAAKSKGHFMKISKTPN